MKREKQDSCPDNDWTPCGACDENNPCEEPTGACCHTDLSCEDDVEETDCMPNGFNEDMEWTEDERCEDVCRGCGNGILEEKGADDQPDTNDDEECDDGEHNGTEESICTNRCTIVDDSGSGNSCPIADPVNTGACCAADFDLVDSGYGFSWQRFKGWTCRPDLSSMSACTAAQGIWTSGEQCTDASGQNYWHCDGDFVEPLYDPQNTPVDSEANKVNVVFRFNGSKQVEAAKCMAEYLLQYEPFRAKENKGKLQFWYEDTVSPASDISDDRQHCECDTSAIEGSMPNAYYITITTDRCRSNANYGISGSACVSLPINPAKVFVHEFGHAFGELEDEYLEDGRDSTARGINCVKQGDPVPWQDLIGQGSGVGLYDGCHYGLGNWRATANSIMRYSNLPNTIPPNGFQKSNIRILNKMLSFFDNTAVTTTKPVQTGFFRRLLAAITGSSSASAGGETALRISLTRTADGNYSVASTAFVTRTTPVIPSLNPKGLLVTDSLGGQQFRQLTATTSTKIVEDFSGTIPKLGSFTETPLQAFIVDVG
ncbi:MAG: hypothetical protein PHO92_04720, partial [Candidatus Peribacteraceae bacterium]|nr:hypothetical protein [Candidatus Peribacteraceae bacterium]